MDWNETNRNGQSRDKKVQGGLTQEGCKEEEKENG